MILSDWHACLMKCLVTRILFGLMMFLMMMPHGVQIVAVLEINHILKSVADGYGKL